MFVNWVGGVLAVVGPLLLIGSVRAAEFQAACFGASLLQRSRDPPSTVRKLQTPRSRSTSTPTGTYTDLEEAHQMNKLRELSAVTKRLFLLTVATAAVAIPALAGCETHNVTCPDGQPTGATVCCPEGYSSGAECVCYSWSASGGYSNCSLTTICYSDDAPPEGGGS